MDDTEVLTPEERRALAHWADHDPPPPPDGFADALVDAWQREWACEVEDGEERASGRRNLVVGIVAGLAAAAMVLLMIRTLPGEARSAPIDGGAAAHGCDQAADGIASSARASALSPASEEGPGALARGALAVLTHHCMPCHDGGDSEAQAGALKVYDVGQPRWWRTMTDAQLQEASLRIQELGAAGDDERKSMAAFVDAELARRERSG